ncbi:putative transcriptional regulator, Crp/Fnr family [Fibrella aestuarina BUZ 2]|uniref:Putative transcriptional regulator, Crp/Fnr family n=1 Tax=Fibrella aestuarina BUZ 2 TaxID=1166018 RepID=I0KBM9_9BACT|nr:Crp/Fnr family transcriptional regulator [Fibrella aestuarina]CCH01532.1 putative transcriptional regulator, Crp/Fnr family [Fibrella aestuarina BUZ 2]
MESAPTHPLLTYLQALTTLPPDLQVAILDRLRRETYLRRQWVLQPGQQADRIYFIEQGVVRGYYLKEGREVTSWFMREGDFIISIVSFYTRQPAQEYIELLTDGTLWSITYEQLQQLYRDYPAFNLVGRLLTEKYYVLSEQRSLNLRMQTASERYQQLLIDFPMIFSRVPLKHIASHLGISAETLSRLRGRKT